jgi:hypothetical protein
MHAGVVADAVVLAFPGSVNWVRMSPAQARVMARKLWRLAEECELQEVGCGTGPDDAIVGTIRPHGSEVETAVG